MIEIYGIDIDTVVVESDIGKTEEITLKPHESAIITITNNEGGVEIHTWYVGPTWGFTVLQIPPEETEVPWEIYIYQDSSYSMKLSVECRSEDVDWKYEVR